MKGSNPYNEYRKNEILTASPNKLVILLYDGAIKNLKLTEYAMKDNDIEKTNKYIKKAQDIISEFMITLDFEKGKDISENLYSLYEYMNNKLIQSNIKKDIDGVIEVRAHLEELRSTWAQI